MTTMADRLCKDDNDTTTSSTTTTMTTSLNKHNVDDDNVSIVVQLLKTLPMNCGVCVQGVLRSITAAAANGD